MKPKDLLFAPIYLYQGKRVKANTPRLPEPEGQRFGLLALTSNQKKINTYQDNDQVLRLMVVGDSAAAGVGAYSQDDALSGQLPQALCQNPQLVNQYDAIEWSLHATTGHTSFDLLRRLYVLPKPKQAVDVMVVSIGVNDTTQNISHTCWQEQIEQIILIAKRKFAVRWLIFSSLPPMALMPALPTPLNAFIGAKATALDDILKQTCQQHDGVYHLAIDFNDMGEKAKENPLILFATDGFHPSAFTYRIWGERLAQMIATLVNSP